MTAPPDIAAQSLRPHHEEPGRVVLQRGTFPEGLSPENIELYARVTPGFARFFADGLELGPGVNLRTSTYFNAFALGRCRSLTSCSSFNCEVRVQGRGRVSVVAMVAGGEHVTYEKVLGAEDFDSQEAVQLRFSLDHAPQRTEGVFLWVQAASAMSLQNLEFVGHLKRAQLNSVDIAYVVTTFNREAYVSKMVREVITPLGVSANVRFIIVNQGSKLTVSLPSNAEMIQNRNLGGAGGFARGAMAALSAGATHVTFMDDDIELTPEAIQRTIGILRCLREEYAASIIAGAMSSSEQRWLQYERFAHLTTNGFNHVGANRDLREYDSVLEELRAEPEHWDVLAGWWYCVFPTATFRRYGLPLPVFFRGDDIEFSLRIKPTVITCNGICVWHEPFDIKFSDVSENYYLPRNMTLIALLNQRFFPSAPKTFLLKRFVRNLATFNYLGASLNILALRHIARGTYRADSGRTFALIQRVAKRLQAREDKRSGPVRPYAGFPPPANRITGRYRALGALVLQYISPIELWSGVSRAGWGRAVRSFVGRHRVEVYDVRTRTVRSAVIHRRQAFRLTLSMLKWWRILSRRRDKLSFEAEQYRRERSQPEAWLKEFELTATVRDLPERVSPEQRAKATA